ELQQARSAKTDLEQQLRDSEAASEARMKEALAEKPLEQPADPTELQTLRSENETLRKAHDNLKREQKLMASAFMDQSSRIQYVGTTVQRRSEQPSSWLGRQRRIVDGAGMGRR
ncbi:MAG: hypothetical protein Q9183_007624, partial [Haloplaca sp. 2 TL-2023]